MVRNAIQRAMSAGSKDDVVAGVGSLVADGVMDGWIDGEGASVAQPPTPSRKTAMTTLRKGGRRGQPSERIAVEA